MTPEMVTKVENRLCSAKSVAEGVKVTVAWVLGEEGAKLLVGDVANARTSTASREPKLKQLRQPAGKASKNIEGDRLADHDDRHIERSKDDLRHGSDDEMENDDQDRTVEDVGWESGSISDAGHGKERSGASDDDEPSLTVPKRLKRAVITATSKKKAKPSAPSKGSITSSTFLPTLSTGFTLGDSDSDPDLDRDPGGIVGTQKPERKNRRGQRARQAYVQSLRSNLHEMRDKLMEHQDLGEEVW